MVVCEQVQYTILIMRDTDKPPILRVTPKQSTAGVPLAGGLFTPVAPCRFPRVGDVTKWQGEETSYDGSLGGVEYAQRYGQNAPVPELAETSVPGDYIRINYTTLFWLYVPFFTVPMLISWYYLVTLGRDYDANPFAYTAGLVRVPLMLLGVYTGSILYAVAQGILALAFVTRAPTVTDVREDAPKGRNLADVFYISILHPRERLFRVLLFVASVLNITHVGLWGARVSWRRGPLAFTPYMEEYRGDTGGALQQAWGSTLLVPLMGWFLVAEPAVAGVLHFILASRDPVWWILSNLHQAPRCCRASKHEQQLR